MYPRSDREFIVATDAATGVGVGACLKQVDDDGVERVVSYNDTYMGLYLSYVVQSSLLAKMLNLYGLGDQRGTHCLQYFYHKVPQ